MKLRNFFFFLTILSAFALFSCANESAKTDSSAKEEASVEQVADKTNTEVKSVNEADVPQGPSTTMEFQESEYDFGKITEGDKVQHIFKFKNSGSEPLTIKNAKGSCGCTVPEWPKEPISPGESGEIKVEFNSKKKPGKQSKYVTITANTDPPQTRLKIMADVQPNPDAETATK